jgi:hypothetical protein
LATSCYCLWIFYWHGLCFLMGQSNGLPTITSVWGPKTSEEIFLRITQYNATRTHTYPYEHVCKSYPYEHLWKTEHRQIWRFPKPPLASCSLLLTGMSLTT